MKKVSIIPAILEKTFREIHNRAEVFKNNFDYVQIDVVDGVYAESSTWPFLQIEELHHVRSLLAPFPVHFELDLMIQKPERTLPVWLSTQAKRVIIHPRSTENLERCIDDIIRSGKEVCIALYPDDDPQKFFALAPLIHAVQVMGISSVGKQGQPFDERCLDVIRQSKIFFPKAQITVDGGVSLETCVRLKKAGAARLVIGSAFTHGDVGEIKSEFEKVV